jgi:probable DNA metabolism protein
LRSYDETKETVIFNLAVRCIKERRNVLTDYTDPNVLAHYDLCKKIGNEIHRAHGFLRFKQCIGGLYANFELDNDIVDLVAPHFAKRFSGEKFIIHDIKRNLICAYDGKSLQTIKNDGPVSVFLTEDEKVFDSLWKTYFKSVNIESRKNLRQQANFLPRRYRKNMNEFL